MEVIDRANEIGITLERVIHFSVMERNVQNVGGQRERRGQPCSCEIIQKQLALAGRKALARTEVSSEAATERGSLW